MPFDVAVELASIFKPYLVAGMLLIDTTLFAAGIPVPLKVVVPLKLFVDVVLPI